MEEEEEDVAEDDVEDDDVERNEDKYICGIKIGG